MIEGIFGVNQNIQPNNAGNKNTNSQVGGVDFKNTMIEMARAASITIADKGNKEQMSFNKWRDLEDSLYFNPQVEEEELAEQYLNKLKRILTGKLPK